MTKKDRAESGTSIGTAPGGSNGIKEIARRANVSIATVDRVIHNRSGVSEKTKKKINEIIARLNYQPNIFARRLASRNILRFAVVIPQASNETEYWQVQLDGIRQAEEEIKQFGIVVETFLFDLNQKNAFRDAAKEALQSKPDGILLAPSFLKESALFVEKCKEKQIPYVFINSDLPENEALAYIGPELVQSGYLSAQLMHFILHQPTKVLVVNISKLEDSLHHLLMKEQGVKKYFTDHHSPHQLVKMDIHQTDLPSVVKEMEKKFEKDPDIGLIFVTNSQVYKVARFLEKAKRKDVLLIGFDFLKNNIEFLNKNIIQFLICQKPMQQGYKGVMALYQHLVLKTPVEKKSYMPIDIITRENQHFYKN